MGRAPTPTWCYAPVVVRRGAQFLVVEERGHGGGFYLPAGGVEPGERFEEAALRETREEAGLDVILEGIVRVEYRPVPDGARMRVLFVARPVDDTPPKSRPDEHSLGARWVTLDELATLPQRGDEIMALVRHVESGGQIFPLSALTSEW